MNAKSLQEQIRSTRYGKSEDEDFEDFIATSSPKVSGKIIVLPIEQLVEYKDEEFERITGRPQPFHPYSQKKYWHCLKVLRRTALLIRLP